MIRKLTIIVINMIAWALMLSNNTQNIILGIAIVFFCYCFLLAYFVSDHTYYIVSSERIAATIVPRATQKFKFEEITSYKVDKELLTKEKWNEIKNKLNSFSIEFLKENFPNVEWISTISLASYDEVSAGRFINIDISQNILFGDKFANQILLNEAFIYAVLKYNDFGIILPILEHELVHYALWYQNKGYHDGNSDFEKKIAELNIRSNNAEVVNIYSLGIVRKKTENGFEDTLNLIIPPSKTDKENDEALALYKKKYDLKENA